MRYVAFEGLDGSGKSTLLAAVAAALRARGDEVQCVREPGALGEKFRELLMGEKLCATAQMFAFLADRAQNFAHLEAAWQRPGWLLSDRSFVSHLAYATGFEMAELVRMNLLATGGRAPDVVVFLRASVQLASARIAARGGQISPLETAAALEKLRYSEALAAVQALGARVIELDAAAEPASLCAQVLAALGV